MRSLILLLLLALASASCATHAETGTLAGGAGGAAIGGALGGWQGALIGGALGGIGGFAVGRSMDEQDRIRAAQALEYNRAMEWQDQRGYSYRMEPGGPVSYQGRECRNYRLYGNVEGRPETINGIACRGPNGQWQSVSG